ncbi:MAG: riboflavin synthase [Leptotrichiaceae bacterium]|nr:riboflavin synthase [Leptotrichiaceae bacterium]MBP6280650.1 riboflavin synthase [Leptotrichiaceae bacterium]MBP7100843.1 riboflavin synthase [Leptotrichiaceae bacterium]MBP7725149.1 riboflavin synthase [Leptotrichiaceae bacterium]MBP9629168.1 riboflavin synthase [Leptotrichiaceae bacterium]
MFTGLVEEMGEIANISRKDTSLRITIKGNSVIKNVKIGDSIAVNGICLTVTEFNKNTFTADVMYETIERSGLKRATSGNKVNLEKSLTLTTFLGGHLVMGDIDCEAKILSITPKGIAKLYEFQLEEKHKNNIKYVVEKGRVTIDGASLTVINVKDELGVFTVSLIPHTLENIVLGRKKIGDFVNIETDLFGKYIEKIIKFNNIEKEENKSEITREFLYKNGF